MLRRDFCFTLCVGALSQVGEDQLQISADPKQPAWILTSCALIDFLKIRQNALLCSFRNGRDMKVLTEKVAVVKSCRDAETKRIELNIITQRPARHDRPFRYVSDLIFVYDNLLSVDFEYSFTSGNKAE